MNGTPPTRSFGPPSPSRGEGKMTLLLPSPLEGEGGAQRRRGAAGRGDHTLGTTPFSDGTKSPSALGGQGIASNWSNRK